MNKYTFIKPDPALQNNLMAFGFECGKGWYPLIEELFDELQEKINNNPEYSDFKIVQVKEKWARLTIYGNHYYKELEDLISEYENKSLTVCERCGSTENVSTEKIKGWYTTICKSCKGE